MTQRKIDGERRMSIYQPLRLRQEERRLNLTAEQMGLLQGSLKENAAFLNVYVPYITAKANLAGIIPDYTFMNDFRDNYIAFIRHGIAGFIGNSGQAAKPEDLLLVAFGIKQLFPEEFAQNVQPLLDQQWEVFANSWAIMKSEDYLIFHCVFPQISFEQLRQRMRLSLSQANFSEFIEQQKLDLRKLQNSESLLPYATSLYLLASDQFAPGSIVSEEARRHSERNLLTHLTQKSFISLIDDAYPINVLAGPPPRITQDGIIVIDKAQQISTEEAIPQIRRQI